MFRENDIRNRKSRNRKRRRRRSRVSAWITVPLGVIAIFAVLGLIGAFSANQLCKHFTGASLMACRSEAMQTIEESKESDFYVNKKTVIYDANGEVITTLSDGASTDYIPYDRIPKHVVNAFVAVEDQSFWENKGFDPQGMARVLYNYVRTKGDVAQGASTITQQLARTVFLSTEKSMSRKIREIFLSYYMTKKYTKEQIMEFYVNNCCFANNTYGIQAASRMYLGKDVSQISLLETAYLCAIPNRPEYYNPYNNMKNATKRCTKILNDMKKCGYISEVEYQTAVNDSVTIVHEGSKALNNYTTTYAVKCVVEYMMQQNGFAFRYDFASKEDRKEYLANYEEVYTATEHDLNHSGYQIYTSLDLKAQGELQNVIDRNLNISIETNLDTGDFNLQGAMTVIDNETKKVVAIIGGRSQVSTATNYSLNRAFQSTRQPGSSIKPVIVYTPAMSLDLASTSTSLRNINVERAYDHPDEVENMYGGRMALRRAVEQSVNGCAVYLFSQVEPKRGMGFLQKMHFSAVVPDDYYLSSALGGMTYGTNTEEMANAYLTIYNHGKYTDVNCITSIRTYDGEEIYQEAAEEEVYTQKAADSMTDVMRGVVRQGTASGMGWRNLWRESDKEELPAAGKTGTTNDSTDGWFCGFTPYYTIAVWVGNDDATEVSDLWGSTYPAAIWKEAMFTLTADKPYQDFELDTLEGEVW